MLVEALFKIYLTVPQIPACHFGRHKGEAFLGASRTKTNPFPFKNGSFFRDLIFGLQYIHGEGIVHRDILSFSF